MHDHDVRPGWLEHCQICGSSNLRKLIDLGHQPPCDSLLTADQLHQPEVTYPLQLNQCEECSLAQLDYIVPANHVYPANYPYRAGLSLPIVDAHHEMASYLVKRFGVGRILDIGSNDGTLLQQFQSLGCTVQGVEPTDIAEIAEQTGIPTCKDFFTEDLASRLGRFDIITMTNVFAHMADLGEVMRGILRSLNSEGVLVIENHYLLDVLEKNQFDTVYHEHVRTYTLKSLIVLFAQYGLEVFDVERVPRYGGNIRVFVARTGKRIVEQCVGRLMLHEKTSGVADQIPWRVFRSNVERARQQFMEAIVHRDVVGCSAPGRASTLLNYFGVRPTDLPWTGEVAGSLKIGKFLPGCHIPVVSNQKIVDEQPDYVVLLAWHYVDVISKRLRSEGVRSTLLAPLPHFGIVL